MSKTKAGTLEVEIEERRFTGSTKNAEKLCGASLAEYVGTGDRDENFLAIYF